MRLLTFLISVLLISACTRQWTDKQTAKYSTEIYVSIYGSDVKIVSKGDKCQLDIKHIAHKGLFLYPIRCQSGISGYIDDRDIPLVFPNLKHLAFM